MAGSIGSTPGSIGTDTEPDPSPGPARRGVRVGRVLAVTATLALVLFWLWIFVGGPSKKNPDYLTDRGWTERAEATCKATVNRIDALPEAPASRDNVARAAVVAQANDELDSMLDRLEADEPNGSRDREVVRPWLADWRTYLTDRQDYAARLRDDPSARLLVDEKFRDNIDTVIQTFAEVNEIESCAPPGDVG